MGKTNKEKGINKMLGKDHINFKIIKNDLTRNKTGNIAFLLFMFLATALISVSVLIVSELLFSISGMYEKSAPPHFAQIHLGEVTDTKNLSEFMQNYEGLTDWQTQTLINLYGDGITVITENETIDMSDCRLDISLVTQNKYFDYLLDDDGNIAEVQPGEIGFPVILLDKYPVKIGDHVNIELNGVSKDFVVGKYIHDGAMNSSFASSTRILVTKEDFEVFHGSANTIETLIEARFTDTALASGFQTAYENAGLPQNGQAITYAAIFLLSAMTDIMIAFILVFTGIILIWIASFCVKYTIMATMEEEISEIGTMKAIGLSHKDIRSIYLGKYVFLLAIGSILGYLFACLTSNIFTEHIVRTFVKQELSIGIRLLPIIACLLVLLITTLYCIKVLNKMKKVTIVNALVTGEGFAKRKRKVKIKLWNSHTKDINFTLSIKEAFHHFREYALVFFVVLLATMIMEIPMNLVSTFSSEKYMPYLGRAMTDVVLDFQIGEDGKTKYDKVMELLNKDPEIKDVKVYENKRIAVENGEENYNLRVECGVGSGQGIHYIEGKAPESEGEIALSYNNSKQLEKKVGDIITVANTNGARKFVVCGIYQDITSGGLTAKSIGSVSDEEPEQYMMGIELLEGVDPKAKAEAYRSELGFGYEVEPVKEFVTQIFGSVMGQLGLASKLIALFGMIIIILVIVLFLKLRMVKDVAETAGLKAIGFTNTDIRLQYLYKIGSVSLIAVILGTIAFKPIGEAVVGGAFQMAGIGIVKMTFLSNIIVSYVLMPIAILIVVAIMVWICTMQVKKYNIVALINE